MIECPWVTTAEQAEAECNHRYDGPSDDGTARWNGKPAYLRA